jgi:hypothetical protein
MKYSFVSRGVSLLERRVCDVRKYLQPDHNDNNNTPSLEAISITMIMLCTSIICKYRYFHPSTQSVRIHVFPREIRRANSFSTTTQTTMAMTQTGLLTRAAYSTHYATFHIQKKDGGTS